MNDIAQAVTKMSYRWLVFSGLVVFVLGILAICSLFIAGLVMALVVGFVLVIGGMAQLLHVLKTGPLSNFFMDFVSSMLSIICGGLMVLHPILGLDFLTLMLILYFLVQGLMTVAFGLARHSVKDRVWLLLYGLCEILLGALFWYLWPVSKELAIGLVVGIHLLLKGLSMTSRGLVLRKVSVSGKIAAEHPASGPIG